MLFNDLKASIAEALKTYPDDLYLDDMSEYLASKSFKYFTPKSKLSQLVAEVGEHIDSLVFEVELDVIDEAIESDEEMVD